jgi:Nitrous oxide-stimulated promoter
MTMTPAAAPPSFPAADLPPNIVLDERTVAGMVHIYCEQRHGSPRGTLCPSCGDLLAYARVRLAKCPFGPDKTTCRECPIHCYRPAQRAAMKTVMRDAGPRMLWRHPLLAIRHLWLDRKGPPPWPLRKGRTRTAIS